MAEAGFEPTFYYTSLYTSPIPLYIPLLYLFLCTSQKLPTFHLLVFHASFLNFLAFEFNAEMSQLAGGKFPGGGNYGKTLTQSSAFPTLRGSE